MMAAKKLDPNDVKTRDPLMVKVINGATKSAIHVDRKKRQNKYASRKKVRDAEDD